jgi:hypothetical protein
VPIALETTQSVRKDRFVTAKDVLLGLALANICLSEAWKKILFDTPLLMPFWSWRDLAAMVINIFLLGTIFWALISFSRKPKFRQLQLHGILFLLPLLVVLNLYRSSHGSEITRILGSLRVTIVVLAGILLLALVLIARFRKRIIPILELITLSTLLLVPLNFFRAVLVLAQQEPLPRMATWLPDKPQNTPRVVWIILDETDWRLAFPERPQGVSLPNYDRLRASSLFAENAYQAGSDTQVAMPSLISGKQISGTTPVGKHTLLLKTAGSNALEDWATEPNVFSGARSLGFNVGIVGWYLPYCRVFASALSSCYWESMTTRVNSREPTLAASLFSQWRSLTPLESRLRQRFRFNSMLDQAKELASNPKLGLVLIHMSVPHGPGIYDRQHNSLTSFDLRNDWYFDNLELSDRALGEIRNAMERAGQWDRSTVIVSSDHSLRRWIMVHPHFDKRVPFLVKAAQEGDTIDYQHPFNAVVTSGLILSVLRGETTTPKQISDWLDKQSTRVVQ